MAEQRRLPFVWELDNNGVVSHAIGCVHRIPKEISYEQDLLKYAQGKRILFLEEANWTEQEAGIKEAIDREQKTEEKEFLQYQMATYGILERTLTLAAQNANAAAIPLDSPDEHQGYGELYKGKLSKELDEKMRAAYYAGDEQTLRGLIEKFDAEMRKRLTPHEYEFLHPKRHKKMAVRSANHMQQPCLIAVGIMHYLLEPSVLTIYKDRGISVERLQPQ